jgi:D-proline reductase (dithiol) PrdB
MSTFTPPDIDPDIDPESAQTLDQWVRDPEVAAWLAASEWKPAFARYTYLNLQTPPPFTPLKTPLRESTLVVITTGGLYIEGEQAPFEAADVYGDASTRLIPIATPYARLRIAHDHYDHSVPEQDLRTINPVEHLRALVREGSLGALHPQLVSLHGYVPDWRRVFAQTIPAVITHLTAHPIDAALLVPV